MKRKYVDVICLNDHEGNITPLFLIWDDNKKIPVTKVRDIAPRQALKSGGMGLRFTCIFGNNLEKHLYYDRGKWFVEAY